MITIVFCHPQTQSFNHRILDAVTKALSDQGREYDVINLYGEHFNPVLDSAGIELYEKGESDDPNVKKYGEALRNTTEIIFIFPIWWGTMPAILKGFIDKTFLKGIAFETTPEGAMMPCLSIDKTTIITTSEEDSEVFGDFIMGYFTPMTLTTVGMNGVTWLNFDRSSRKTDADRQEFITEVLATMAR